MGSAPFFDTVRIAVGDAGKVVADAAAKGVNLRQLDGSTITVALDETTRLEDIDELLAILNGGSAPGFTAESLAGEVRAPCREATVLGSFTISFLGFLRVCVYRIFQGYS